MNTGLEDIILGFVGFWLETHTPEGERERERERVAMAEPARECMETVSGISKDKVVNQGNNVIF